MRIRLGQALMELAVGMFALALVVSALCVFVRYIAKSLSMENHIRCGSAIIAAQIELDDFAAKNVFGSEVLHIKEPRGDPDRTIK